MKLSAIVAHLGLKLEYKDIEISSINTLTDAKEGDLSFLDNPKYLSALQTTKASAVLLKAEFSDSLPTGCTAIVTDEPYLMLALCSALFAKPPFEMGGEAAQIDDTAFVHPRASIGFGAKIGARAKIGAGVSIGDYAAVCDDTVMYPNSVLYRDCKIGARCIIHAGAVIGSDGFGFAHTKTGEHVKIYQNGIAVVEDDVEIGANTTIDRAVFGTTVIRRGCKIDNLVQIGHNCEIGEYSIIVSQSGIAGSTKLGRNVVMGGQSAAAGHLQIGDFATIAARGGVTKSMEGKKTYSGFPLMEHREWLKLQGMLSRLLKK